MDLRKSGSRSVCTSVSMFVHLYVCTFVFMSKGTFVHPWNVYLSICLYICLYNKRTRIFRCPYSLYQFVQFSSVQLRNSLINKFQGVIGYPLFLGSFCMCVKRIYTFVTIHICENYYLTYRINYATQSLKDKDWRYHIVEWISSCCLYTHRHELLCFSFCT